MTYPFTQTEKDELELLRQAAESSNDYTSVYKYILFHTSNFTSTVSDYTQVTHTLLEDASPVSGADASVWLWARGAYGVNDPNQNNFFSDYIRDYTEKQYELRYGGAIGDSNGNGLNDLQDTSNSIADNFASSIIFNDNFPSLEDVGRIDAGAAASTIFDQHPADGDGNYSPWAGTILFPFLGEGSFTSDWLLTTGTNSFKKIEGTYDLISVATVAHEITTLLGNLWNSGAVSDIIANNTLGETATLQLLADLRADASEFFQGVYDLPNIGLYQIGEDLPLYGGLSLDAVDYTIHPNYIIGTLLDDASIATNNLSPISVSGYGGTDIVHAGLGSDTIIGSEGNDLIDGGRASGAAMNKDTDVDTLDYSSVSNGLEVSFENITSNGPAYFDHRVVVDGTGFYYGAFTDYAYDIEKLILTDANDTVILTDDIINADVTYHLDGAAFASGFGDTLDFSALTKGVEINGNKIVGTNITFENFNTLILTDHDDKVRNVNDTQIFTKNGIDTIDLGSNLYVLDASNTDKLSFGGRILKGGALLPDPDSPTEGPWSNLSNEGVYYGQNKNGDLVLRRYNAQEESGEAAPYTYIANYQENLTDISQATAGINVYGIDWGVYRLIEGIPHGALTETLKTLRVALEQALGDEYTPPEVDPFILDLNGNGFDLAPEVVSSPLFDLNGDGFATRTAWTFGGQDGFLAIDLNSNGEIDDISELFGDAQTSGFSALAAYDLDTNGILEQSEADSAGIVIWVDADSDAQTDAGELHTLSDFSIASINLTPTITTEVEGADYILLRQGEFTYTDGSTGATADAAFATNTFVSQWLTDVTITSEAAALPQITGHGTIPSLRAAMSHDPALVTIVENTLPTLSNPDLASLRAGVMPILNGWADSVDVPAGFAGTQNRIDVPVLVQNSIGDDTTVADFGIRRSDAQGDYWELASGDDVLDAQGSVILRPTYADILAHSGAADESWVVLSAEQINFLERWTGEQMPIGMDHDGGSSTVDAMSDVLGTLWNELNGIAVRLASQSGPLAEYFDGLEYNPATDGFEMTSDRQLAPMFERIFQDASGSVAGDQALLDSWKGTLDIVIAQTDRDAPSGNSYAFLFQNLVAAYDNYPLSLSLENTAYFLDIPSDMIVSGAGSLSGSDDADIFYMDGSDQTTQGSRGGDTFVFGRNIGHDIIDEFENTLSQDHSDVIRFSYHNADDFDYRREGNDLFLTTKDTGETVTVINQFKGRAAGTLGVEYTENPHGVNEIIFADGTLWNRVDMAYAVVDTKAHDQVIQGTGQVDVFDGGAGNDTFYGGDQGDIYHFGYGDGQDLIYDEISDVITSTPDVLVFKDGVTLDDLNFIRNGDSDDLTIALNGSSDTISIEKQFWHVYGVPFIEDDQAWFNRIELFTFADDTGLSWEDIMVEIVARGKTAGDDTIYGFDYTDTLDGGAGNDYLSGGNEEDTYIYGLGYGHDTIEELPSNIASGVEGDKVIFGAGINPGDITATRNGDSEDLVLNFADGGSLTIIDQFTYWNFVPFGPRGVQRIEQFEFEDHPDILWDYQHFLDEVLESSITDGDDTIYGYNGYEDILEGGLGDDHILGGYEGDTYIYSRGDGNDVIEDNHNNQSRIAIGNNIDKLEFTDVASTDVSLIWGDGEWDMKIVINDTGETINIVDQNKRFAVGTAYYDIEEVHFSDGVIWTPQQMRDIYIANAGTSGDDFIHGFWTHDILDGGAGDDRLEGSGGGDTYLFGVGSGNDTIYDYIEYVTWTGSDTVEFTGSLLQSDVSFSESTDGRDLIVTLNGHSDTLTIEDQFRNLNYTWIDEFKFSDGSTLSYGDVYSLVKGGAIIEGTTGIDDLNGDNGNNQLFGYEGDDDLFGDDGDDILDGGDGDDLLKGWKGTDQYIASNGHDTIEEFNDSGIYSVDEIVFGPGVTLQDLDIYRIEGVNSYNYYRLVVEWESDGSANKITITDQFDDFNDESVELIRFSDDTTHDLINRDFVTKGTSGNDSLDGLNDPADGWGINDTIYGFEGDDVIQAWNGDDILDGGDGNDTLEGDDGDDIYIASNGHDTIDEKSGLDEIVFGEGIELSDLDIYRANGNDLIIEWGTDNKITIEDQFYHVTTDNQVEQLRFADGSIHSFLGQDFVYKGTDSNNSLSGNRSSSFGLNDTIFGYEGDDTITSRDGNDVVYAGEGDDTVRADDGNDIVYGESGNDELEGEDGNDYLYGGAGNDTLEGGADNDVVDGGDGDDIVDGDSGDDDHFGGAGNDTLIGNSGADTFDGGAGIDTLDFTYTADDASFDLEQGIVTFESGTTEAITSIENVHAGFGDNIIHGSSVANILIGDRGSDDLYGYAGNDVLDGGIGNDHLDGGDGDDTIDGGTGNDDHFGGAGDDTLIGNSGADTFDGGDGNDTLDFTYTDDNASFDLEQGIVTFESGTTEAITSIENVEAGSGDNTINGTAAANILRGGEGADALYGGLGADTLDGGLGTDTADYSGNAQGITVDLSAGSADEDGDAVSDDTLISIENITASNYADTVTGDSGDNVLQGLAGIDTLFGGAGNDTLYTGDGAGVDWGPQDPINGFFFWRVDDSLFGGAGNDTLHAGTIDFANIPQGYVADAFYLNGGEGDDLLIGGNGIDKLEGGAGNDTIQSGSGKDDIIYAYGDGILTLEQQGGDVDWLWINTNGQSPVFETLNNSEPTTGPAQQQNTNLDANTVRIWFDSENYIDITDAINADGTSNIPNIQFDNGLVWTYDIVNDAIVLASSIIFSAPSGSVFTNENDVITNAPTVVDALGGHDVVHGTDANNSFQGGAGNDILHGYAGNDALYGGDGSDTIYGGAGNDDIRGQSADVDYLYGGDGVDTLYGGAGDELYGGDGNDNLRGFGGTGVFDGGEGIDKAWWRDAALAITADLVAGTAQDANGDIATLVNIENLTGSSYEDTLLGDENANILDGGADRNGVVDGGDTIDGRGGNDKIYGRNGDDTLTGGTGNDYLYGGAGSDIIHGGADNDRLYGQGGGDELYGDDGADLLYGAAGQAELLNGGAGDDTINGYSGDDTIDGETGNDRIYASVDAQVDGGDGSDRFYVYQATEGVTINADTGIMSNASGASGTIANIETFYLTAFEDSFTGGSINEIVQAYGGNDVLNGGLGNDTLYGDLGQDTLLFGEGTDALHGGADADTFKAYETASQDTDMALAYNFVEGEDVIDISDLLSGYDPLTDAISDFVNIAQGSHTTIQVDRDGTGSAHSLDNVLRLQSNSTLETDVDQLIADGTLIVV